MSIRNRDLHACMSALVRRYFEFIKNRVDRDPEIPRRRVPRMSFNENGSPLGAESVEEPDLGFAIAATLHEFVKDPRNGALIAEALAQPEVRRVLEQLKVAVVPMSFGYNILQPMIAKQAFSQHGIEFDPESFEVRYAELEEYLSTDVDPYLLSAPLANSTLTKDPVVVGEFTIRNMTKQEFMAFNGIPPDARSFIHTPPYLWSDCLLEMRVQVPRGVSPLSSTDQDRIWWFVACMKLLKQGSIGYEQIWVTPIGWTGMSFIAGSALRLVAPSGNHYSLAAEDFPELERLWKCVEPHVGDPPPFWSLALHRFGDAVNRARADDKFLDLWIACESLFGHRTDTGEIGYQLSLRIAHYLETDPGKREEVRRSAKRAYRARGSVVHGGGAQVAEGLVRQMEELTRQALVKVIASRHTTAESLIEEIERSINGGSDLQLRAPP